MSSNQGIEARLDRIEKMLADISKTLGAGRAPVEEAMIKVELAQVKAQGGDPVQYLKERDRKIRGGRRCYTRRKN
jgi:hypothetical protein